jgi:hypothetical protein
MALGFGGMRTQRWENSSLSVEGGYINLGNCFKIQKQRTKWDEAPESFEGSANFRYKTSETGLLKVFTSFTYGDLQLRFPNLDSSYYKDFFYQKSSNFFVNTN